MQWLDILAKHQREWVNMVRGFGAGDYAEDIVQEMYLKIFKANSGDKAVVNGQPNRAFIWVILKNLFIKHIVSLNKQKCADIEDIRYLASDLYDELSHVSIEKIEMKTMEVINGWNTYERELFKLHIFRQKSMRDISSGTNITLKSIFNTIKNCKKKIRLEVGEDYIDYLNEEYERI